MGVPGLRAYSTRKIIQPPIREKVSIQEEILQWKRTKKNRPKIVIDLRDISHMVIQGRNLQNCLGGQYPFYINYYRSFFKKIENFGADLVFVAAAKKLSDELEIFIPNNEMDYIAFISILDDIDANEGKWSKTIEPKHKKRASKTTEFNMLKLAKQHGEVRINYFRHNQEIAKYANENADAILALITNDTEFLIFDGDYQVWRATDIIVQQMSAYRFCAKRLREHLEMNTQQLELLSALAGTDYLPLEVLEDFYTKIGTESWSGGHIDALAKYIREEVPLLPTTQENDVRFDLEKIARDVFGESYTRGDLNAIQNGLIQYNLNFETNGKYPYKRASLDFCKTHNMFIFKLFTDKVYLIKDISFIDYRNCKLKNYADLVIILLRKLQGILYANELRRPKTRDFCMKYAHDEPFKVVKETIIYPPGKIPELFELVFKTKDSKYDGLRWFLFDWLFEFGPDFKEQLKKNHSKYTAVLVTIKYLLMQGEISTDEADAILMTEHFSRKSNFIPRARNDPEILNTHFIRLAHLYTKMFCLINHCLEVCGLYPYTSMIMFDGPHFHNTLNSLINNRDTMTNALKEIQQLRIYIYSEETILHLGLQITKINVKPYFKPELKLQERR